VSDEPIRSFSGTHLFRPAHLRDAMRPAVPDKAERVERTARLVELVDAHQCPRCGRPFETLRFPAGSRVTPCRCIPVCHHCGQLEGLPALIKEMGLAIDVPDVFAPWRWPLPIEVIDVQEAILAELRSHMRLVQVQLEDLRAEPSSGGWAEFGEDDLTEDDEERRGR
jgi:hypothetical protein